MLEDLGDAFVWSVLVAALLCVLAMVVARWRLKQALRVSPAARTPVPLGWLESTSEPARIHRRLRRSAEAARTCAERDPGLRDLAAEVESHATALEARLIAAADRQGSRAALRAVSDDVTRLDAIVRRLSDLVDESAARGALPSPSDDPLARLSDRLDAIAAARAELTALELPD